MKRNVWLGARCAATGWIRNFAGNSTVSTVVMLG